MICLKYYHHGFVLETASYKTQLGEVNTNQLGFKYPAKFHFWMIFLQENGCLLNVPGQSLSCSLSCHVLQGQGRTSSSNWLQRLEGSPAAHATRSGVLLSLMVLRMQQCGRMLQ